MRGCRSCVCTDEKGDLITEDNPAVKKLIKAVAALKDDQLVEVFGEYTADIRWALWNSICMHPSLATTTIVGKLKYTHLEKGLKNKNKIVELIAAKILKKIVSEGSSVAKFFSQVLCQQAQQRAVLSNEPDITLA